MLGGAGAIAMGSQEWWPVRWGGFRPGAPLATWRIRQPADLGQQVLIARAGASKLTPGPGPIIADRDTELAKLAARVVELLFGERDLRLGFGRTMSDPEKICD